MRERLFARADRWINRANADSGDDPDHAVFAHNQFSTMTPQEKLKFMGISKKLKKWVKKWLKKRKERWGDDSGDDEPEVESEDSEPEADSGDEGNGEEEGGDDQGGDDQGGDDEGGNDEGGNDEGGDDSNGPVSPTDEEGEEGTYDKENGGIDWRVRGAVGNIKNQGGCGSCWAFASVSQLESLN